MNKRNYGEEQAEGFLDTVRRMGGLTTNIDQWLPETRNLVRELIAEGRLVESDAKDFPNTHIKTYTLAGQKILLSSEYGKINNPVQFLRDFWQKVADENGLEMDHASFDAAKDALNKLVSVNDNRPQPDFAALATRIHAANVQAGWWSDIKTGESTLRTRNRPEMLMLAVSEVAEAGDGAFGLMDDKLPHLPMYDVELADFVIRQFDQIGAEVARGAAMPDWAILGEGVIEVDLPGLRAGSRNDRLMEIVKQVARAMEHYRKGRVDSYVRAMAEGIRLVFLVAKIEHIDLLDIIEQKLAFNATREDHKVENRVKEGGKAF